MIQESTEGEKFREIEQDIVERVFEMGDRTVNTLWPIARHGLARCWW